MIKAGYFVRAKCDRWKQERISKQKDNGILFMQNVRGKSGNEIPYNRYAEFCKNI